MDDESIIELFWQRDQRAIAETECRYGQRCRAISRGILSDAMAAEECVNDSYLALWQAIPPQRPRLFPAFLYRIVRNISFDRVKERFARKRGGGEEALIYEELSECLASDFSVEHELEAAELKAQIDRFLLTLSKDDRIIFSSRYWLLLPIAEIARRLGCKESRVKTSLYRSRKRLHDTLWKEGLL